MLKKIKDIMSKKDKNQDKVEELDQDNASVMEEQNEGNEEKSSKKGKKSGKTAELEEMLEEKDQQISELKDKYLRLMAEFDNHKKRTIKEKLDMMKSAAQDTLSALLPVLDDFDRAKKNADDDNSTEQFSEGVSLVYNKLYSILNQRGLEPMETNGEVFDSELHEAITEIPAPSDEMKGKIIDTVEKGYILKEKIIRHAKVVVGK